MRKGGCICLVSSQIPYISNLVFHGEESGIFICDCQSLKTDLFAQIRLLFLMFILVTRPSEF